ncbi:MAG: biotin/lipoyl-binding protein, partial [Congregibacter sp.]|nr:biotin/lipoyl-binding protein [Congregibacter sp.]
MAQETVLVPDIGGSDAAEVVEVLVSPGDVIAIDQGLVVLESDKASMEIPSTVAGTVVTVLVKEGEQLAEGAAVAIIETADAEAEGKADAAVAAVKAGATDAVPESSDSRVSDDQSAAPKVDNPETQTLKVPVPDIGTDEAVDLIEVSVSVGDSVTEGDTLVVLETDKASVEVPSPASGVVKSLDVKEGQQVRQGDILLTLEGALAANSAADPEPATKSASAVPAAAASQ